MVFLQVLEMLVHRSGPTGASVEAGKWLGNSDSENGIAGRPESQAACLE